MFKCFLLIAPSFPVDCLPPQGSSSSSLWNLSISSASSVIGCSLPHFLPVTSVFLYIPTHPPPLHPSSSFFSNYHCLASEGWSHICSSFLNSPSYHSAIISLYTDEMSFFNVFCICCIFLLLCCIFTWPNLPCSLMGGRISGSELHLQIHQHMAALHGNPAFVSQFWSKHIWRPRTPGCSGHPCSRNNEVNQTLQCCMYVFLCAQCILTFLCGSFCHLANSYFRIENISNIEKRKKKKYCRKLTN